MDELKPTTNFAELNDNNVSYFLGLDVDLSLNNMFLAGDRNLVTNGVAVAPGPVVIRTNDTVGWSATMHNGRGQIGLVDGSVRSITNESLQTLLSQTGTNVTRLAVP
jgi:prepilin-type processing-associated H-X9-DG protein